MGLSNKEFRALVIQDTTTRNTELVVYDDREVEDVTDGHKMVIVHYNQEKVVLIYK
jgi:hypothetical protein